MSMRRRVKIGKRKPIEEAEIIVIPMIDTMMFLLFFFMVAALAMVVQAGLPVNLPKASTGVNHSSQNVTITIKPGPTGQSLFYLNTAPITPDAITTGLENLHVTDKNLVIINADKHVFEGDVVTVMDDARKAGVVQFAIATTSKG